uniref:Reverse transcriptase domain-containing protein n=1 Tax=Tanacetum cinerariifolium TaxID=118510 RepID=A0A6L2MPX4_TANCI|nr:reverse transcriptase domain-containing protein [Tanacetum cinerariifolium]
MAEPSSPSKRDVSPEEVSERKDEQPKAPEENKPPEKVIVNDDYPDQPTTIRGNLSRGCRTKLIKVLRKHADAFAWVPTDMIGIPCFVVEHQLKTYPHIEPRVQKKRSIAPDRRKVVKEEVKEYIKNLEAYMDDMVIKSKTKQDLIYDVEETLLTLKRVKDSKGNEGKNIHALVDSKLVASHVKESYEAQGERTNKYKEKVLEVITCFEKFQISHIPREQNRKADILSKLAAVQCEALTNGVLVEELN